MLLLLPPPPSSLFNAINAGGPTLRRGGGRPQKKETSLLHSSLLLHRRPGLHEIPTKHSSSSSSSSSMALDSVPSYPGDLGSSRATRTQQRIRKEERTWTADTYAPYDDGHQWRKYGEKKLSNSNFPRFYYRCTYKNDMKCPATKQVQQKDTSNPPLFSVTYFNHHTCNTTLRPIGSTQDTAAQSSSRKAVSICFGSRATSEQPTFLSSAALQSPVDRANQQQDRGTYAHQFQWADGSSSTGNAPVKMEVEDLTGTSASSNATGGALSRTLLPIGQSRCIEYFQFL